jgi:hypothetical protein
LMVNKRMSHGVSLNGTYTWSKMMEENGGDNIIGGNNTVNPLITEVDRVVQRSLFESDRRHRVTISGVYLLPFGRDGKFLEDAGPVLNAFIGGWEMAGMWLFNTGRPWGLPQNVIYDGNAKIDDVDYNDPRVIRAVRPCVAQMNDAGVVMPMQSFSIAAGCTEPNFIIKPTYTGAYVNFRDNDITRPPFYQFDMNFSKSFRFTSSMRLQIRMELYNILNQAIYDERQYENNPTNALFGTIDKSVIRQSNFPRYGQLGIKLIF